MSPFKKIKAAWIARGILNAANKEIKQMDGTTKPGWQTTEFWGKAVLQGIIIYNTFASHDISPELATKLLAALEAIYIGGRSAVKAAKDIVAMFKQVKTPVVVVPAASVAPSVTGAV